MSETLAHRLQEWAKRTPAAVAIVADGVHTTYGDLAAHAARVAAALRNTDAGSCTPVVILGEPGADLVAAVYGCWHAGAVPCLLSNAPQEWAACLALVGARSAWIAGTQRDADRFEREAAAAQVEVRRLPAMDACANVAAVQPAPGAMAAGDACIMFTSGTTGRPKGVVLTHAGLVHNYSSIALRLALSPVDRAVSALPLNYSYGASVVHSHLWAGASVVLERGAAFPQRLLERIQSEQATGLSAVASTFATLLARCDPGRYDLGSLRYLTQAGSPLAPALARQLRAAFPARDIHHMYGQTEATARITMLGPDDWSGRPDSVGLPLAGVEIQVRDGAGEVLPPGEVGEIWASGPNLMRAYHGDPESTAAVLVGGWLRTGDFGRLDADGFLYIEGRRSDMIKVGGQRVNPAEIEHLAAEWPGVSSCAAVGAEDAVLGEVVRLFVVPGDAAVPDLDALLLHLKARLARHKVPRYIQVTDALPVTASGKVKRHVLRDAPLAVG